MVSIKICIGSACHLKGSYGVIAKLQGIVAQRKLSDKVDLSAVFCLGHCTEGVSVKVGEDIYSVSADTAESFFDKNIVPLLETEG